MALIEAVRPLILKEPGKWKIADICAGVPLTGIIAAHLFKVELVTAYDWRAKLKLYDSMPRVQSFRYKSSVNWDEIKAGNTIVVSASPNADVAENIAVSSREHRLPMAMIPARVKGRAKKGYAFAAELFGTYAA